MYILLRKKKEYEKLRVRRKIQSNNLDLIMLTNYLNIHGEEAENLSKTKNSDRDILFTPIFSKMTRR